MHQLEVDLKAGLNDRDHERVLDSIRMLGNMRHVQSKEELVALLHSQDQLVRTYVFEAMLRLHDYFCFACRRAMAYGPTATPPSLTLPGMRCSRCKGRLAGEISMIRDPPRSQSCFACCGFPSPFARQAILQAVRAN